MRRALESVIVIALLCASLIAAQRSRVTAPVGAESVLHIVGDSERDLTRMPSRFTRIPDVEETKYGDTLAEQILDGRSMTADDATVEEYLVSVGGRIAGHVHRRLKMRVHYLPDRDFFNAFAIPGGHVFIGGGLLRELNTEDQLASVIAHEMEHIDHYHCAERLQVEAALRKIPLGFIVQIPIEVFQAGYSKEQEFEADREGVRLAAKAGYSAKGAVDLFDLLARLEGQTERVARTPQEELAQVTVGALTGYFRSHPLIPERISQVKTMMGREPQLAATPQRPLTVAGLLTAVPPSGTDQAAPNR
jgi:predicted Zn-dependent protease